MAKLPVAKAKETKKIEKEVTFEFFAPQAKDVSLAGSFNDWNPAKQKLRKSANGRWTAKLELKPGRYEYRYLVDGNWENDQRPVPCIPNAFGSWNCVIEVQ